MQRFQLIVGLVAMLVTQIYGRESHFGQPCQLCSCFVTYSDRDVSITQSPYKVSNSYEITEDACLAQCLKDEKCKTVVFGYVGGREAFTCDFYGAQSLNSPIYAPSVNIYVKRGECKKQYAHYRPVEGEADDQSVFARKRRYLKVHERPNPFTSGRR